MEISVERLDDLKEMRNQLNLMISEIEGAGTAKQRKVVFLTVPQVEMILRRLLLGWHGDPLTLPESVRVLSEKLDIDVREAVQRYGSW